MGFLIGTILALPVAIEEWSLQFFSTCTFDLLDLLASYAGNFTFSRFAYLWNKYCLKDDSGNVYDAKYLNPSPKFDTLYIGMFTYPSGVSRRQCLSNNTCLKSLARGNLWDDK